MYMKRDKFEHWNFYKSQVVIIEENNPPKYYKIWHREHINSNSFIIVIL